EDARTAVLFANPNRALVVRQPRHESDKGRWEVWDLEHRQRIRAVGPVDIEVGTFGRTPLIAPDGKSIAFLTHELSWEIIELIDVDSGTTVELDRHITPRRSRTLLGPVYLPAGRHILFGTWTEGDCEVRCWDVSSRKRIWSKEFKWPSSPTLDVTSDGQILLFNKEQAQSLDPVMGEPTDVSMPKQVRASWRSHFTSDGRAAFMTAKDEDFRLSVWDWRRGHPISPESGWAVSRSMWPVSYCQDGKSVLTSNRDYRYSSEGYLQLFDLATGRAT